MWLRGTREGHGAGGGSLASSCSEVRSLLSLIVDHEANDLERARAARHLAGCASCRSFQSFAQRTGAVLHAEGFSTQVVVSGTRHGRRRNASARGREQELAARLASMMKERSEGEAGPVAPRSAFAAAALVAAMSLGIFIGGLGVWTLTQDTVADEAGYPLGSPRIIASRTLDPGTDVQERVSILASWVPRRLADDPYWEKWMMGLTPMSLYDEVHYRPENL